MRIFVLSSSEDLNFLSSDEKIIHFSYRPTGNDIVTAFSKSSSLVAIQMPVSYSKNMASFIHTFLAMNHIRLIEGTLWGHRKDIYPYYDLKEAAELVRTLKSKNISEKDAVLKIEKSTGLSPAMSSFLYEFII